MRKKNTIMAIMLAVVAVMSIAYAYFATNLNITSTGSISSSWDVRFTNITNDTPVGSATNLVTPSYTATTATMSADLKLPGDSITYRITLKNNGDIGAIIESIDASATGSGAIIFSISGLNIGDKLAGGDEKEIVVKIEYDPNTTSQPSETEKTLTVSIKAVQDTGQSIEVETPGIIQGTYLSTAILNNNTALDGNTFSSSRDAGLYYTSTNTEDNGTTYYFSGIVDNNYVKFGKDSKGNDIVWRIVRINEDGSIRIVTQNSVSSSVFNSLSIDNAYVGYMFGDEGALTYSATHTNKYDSSIKSAVDNWYLNSTNLSSYVNSHLADAGFCNDRSVSSGLGYGIETTTYMADYRGLGNSPQFKCPNENNDLFTTSSSKKGNKALVYPIGLLTLDEIVYAGGSTDPSISNTYLANGAYYWTMSPSIFDGYSAYMNFMVSDGNDFLGSTDVSISTFGVRPVINVKGNVEVTLTGTGDPGTSTNPYIIETN